MLKAMLLWVIAGFLTSQVSGKGFLGWFESELRTVKDVRLEVDGHLPTYLGKGLFVQPGPGLFELGERKMGHALDGFSKINRLEFDASTNSIRFSAEFLESGFYNDSMKEKTVAHGMLLCETIPARAGVTGILDVLGQNDNNYIKAHKIGDAELIASDTNVVTFMSNNFGYIHDVVAPGLMTNHPHWQDDIDPIGHMCIMATMAHGQLDPETGAFITAGGCVNLIPDQLAGTHYIFQIHPSNPRKRELISKLQLPGQRPASYMHAFGMTKNYFILVASPLYMSMAKVLEGKSLAEGGLEMPDGDPTLFQIVDRKTGKLVKNIFADPFLFGHIVNAYEDEASGDIVLDLTYYTMSSRSFFQLYKVKTLESKPDRDLAPRYTLMRYRLNVKAGSVQQSYTLPNKPANNIEVPKINPAYAGRHYCVFFGVQFGSNETEGFGSAAVVKRNVCTGETITRQQSGYYPAEHEFVPKPQGAEDEGVLVGIVYNSTADTSFVQVLDAQTLNPVAKAPLGLKVPFPVHATWFPSKSSSEEESRAEYLV
eukprot:TRINITY_DN2308_c0_g1_i1.p1 TRINITY_DN2308_c0_g1~~TRINITY_DN2308_c0_g1_i1.p1  ORF type:complete len:539 (+),score=89.28 TRINITY_DN2308_c0_g1_i1:96-1712(+)